MNDPIRRGGKRNRSRYNNNNISSDPYEGLGENFDGGIPITSVAPQNVVTQTPQRNFVDDNLGDIANTLNLVNQLSGNDSFDTSLDFERVDTPRYYYRDRSGAARNRNSAIARAGRRGLIASSSQNTIAGNAAITAAELNANNELEFNEGRREDLARTKFIDDLNRTNIVNTSIANQEEQLETTARNRRIAANVGAYDSFLRGIVGNAEQREQREMQSLALRTVLGRDRTRGVSDRFVDEFPELTELLQ